MMNYELAKKLKDAGFDQRTDGRWLTEDGHEYTGGTEPHYKSPTLTEIIEALNWTNGYTKFCLESSKDPVEWRAWMDSHYDIPSATGSTPDIAVANLWLALNT